MKRSTLTRKTPMARTAMKRTVLKTQGIDVSIGRPEYKTKHWKVKTPAMTLTYGYGEGITGKLEQPKAAKNRPAQRSGPKRISPQRVLERQQYNRQKPAYLAAHPYCQITIAVLGLDEADVIKHHGAYRKLNQSHTDPKDRSGYCYSVSQATELHHRNKANGPRLINFDYVMSASPAAHDWAERKKDHARRLGILCPINCKPDGTMPDGTKQPTTTELLAQRNQQKSQ